MVREGIPILTISRHFANYLAPSINVFSSPD